MLEPWRYVVTFPEEGAPQTSLEYPSHSPGPTPLGHLGAWINDMLSTHATPRPLQFSPNFYYFYICLSVLKMYWVVLTAKAISSHSVFDK